MSRERVLDGLAAADPGAVVPALLPATDALDHHQARGVRETLVSPGQLFLQLELGPHPVVLAVEVLGGPVLVGARGEDGGAVADRLDLTLRLHRGDEVAHVSRRVRYGRRVGHVDQGMLVDLTDQILHVGLDVQPLQGGLDPPRHAAQLLLPFHQVHLESLVGQAQRGCSFRPRPRRPPRPSC